MDPLVKVGVGNSGVTKDGALNLSFLDQLFALFRSQVTVQEDLGVLDERSVRLVNIVNGSSPLAVDLGVELRVRMDKRQTKSPI